LQRKPKDSYCVIIAREKPKETCTEYAGNYKRQINYLHRFAVGFFRADFGAAVGSP
jgi:hypothetical protein